MSFTFQNFWRTGGGGGNTNWYYKDTADNVASLAVGVINSTYFQEAFDTYTQTARAGDSIKVVSLATNPNMATVVEFGVPTTWDANGASIWANFAADHGAFD